MKIKRFENNKTFNVSEMLSEKFFEVCGNFGSEEEKPIGVNVKLSFYFVILEDIELNQVMICRNYIGNYQDFYLSPFTEKGVEGIFLKIILTKQQHRNLEERLLLEKDAKNYNL